MNMMKHIQTWLLITLLALFANGAVSAKVASGPQNLSGNLHQSQTVLNALLHQGLEQVSTTDTSGSPLAAKGATKTVDDLVKGSNPGRGTKGRTTQRDRTGGLDQANKDFDDLGPSGVKDIPGGRTGVLSDGSKVNVRSGSTDGRPTLEIQKGKKKTKFRFDD